MTLHPALALAASLLLSLVAVAGPLDPGPIRRIAFVVGTNDGGGTRARLRYAESDAKSVADVVGRLGGVGSEDSIVLLAPDRARFVAELDRLGDRLRAPGPSRRVELIFYYSGHSDEEGLLFGEERFPYRDLRARLDALPADVRIAILDSCASGAMTRRKGGTWKPPFVVDDSSKVKGHAILTSSADDESAQESDRLQASFFTHYLLSGLRGAADVTGDGRVTLNEAYQFAFNETLARTEQTQGGAQHPAYDIQLSGTGDLVMTDLRGAGAGLRLAGELDGRVFVRDTNGRLAAELRKFPGRPVDLGLDAGDYAVTLTTGGQWYGARVRLVDSRRTDLVKLQMLELPKELAQARGGTHVPPTPPTNEPTVEKPAEIAAPTPPAPTPAPDIPGVPKAVDEGVKKIADEMKSSLGGNNPEDALYDHQFVRLGIVPGFSLGFPPESGRRKVIATLALNIFGRTDKLYGVGLGVGASMVGEDLRGAVASTGFNLIGRDGRGAAAAAGFNIVDRNFEGFVGSAGFNIVGGQADGLLAAGGFNIVSGPDIADRVQTLVMGAGGFNIAGGAVVGVQAAGGFNIASGPVRGVQAAGGFNVSEGLRGAQLAIINISGDVTGAQVGVINVAGKVKGAQIGVVNMNEDIKGVPLGLLTISRKGMFHPQLTWSSARGVGGGLKIGSRHIYSVIDGAIHPGPGDNPWSVLFGLGVRLPISSFYLDIDASTGNLLIPSLWRSHRRVHILTQLRAVAGWQPLSHLGVFAGGSLNMTYDNDVPLPETNLEAFSNVGRGVYFAPGLVGGVSF